MANPSSEHTASTPLRCSTRPQRVGFWFGTFFVGWALGCLVLSLPGTAADAVAARADARKHLVLDPRLFAETRDVRLVLGRVEKAPQNPLLAADRPWENSLNNLYPNVVFDPQRRCFRLWYKCVLADQEAIAKMMPPATVHDVGWFLLYAE